MTVGQVAEAMGLRVCAGADGLDREITGIYCCDLLSMAMARVPADSAWLTVMGNVNVIAVASLADAACVVIAEGVEPDGNTIEKANQQGIVLLATSEAVYETAKAIDALITV